MKNTQLLFWEVALPLTAIIGGISLLVAYKGTQIGERLVGLRESMREGKRTKRGYKAPKAKQSRRRDEEEVSDTEPKLLPAPSTLKRRKRTATPFVIPTKVKPNRSSPRRVGSVEVMSV